MGGTGEPFVVKVYPRKHVSDTLCTGHIPYRANNNNMTIFQVDSGFSAPEGANIVAANDVNVSS